MTLNHPLRCAALGLVCALMGAQVRAVDFDGTFVGAVSLAELLPHSQNAPHPASYYEGAPVVGSFALHLPDPQPFEPPGANDAMYTDAAGSLSFSYTLQGVVYSFATEPGGIPLSLRSPSAGDPNQSLSVETTAGFFDLSGPAGSLFSGLDASTLHVDPTASYTGRNALSSVEASMTFYVAMTQIAFASPVPEPTSSALLVVGGALLAWTSRRRGPGPSVGVRV